MAVHVVTVFLARLKMKRISVHICKEYPPTQCLLFLPCSQEMETASICWCFQTTR
ncbi:hypothetical protein I79_017640 [Cricetulus griseus]|uniref:Uncharacterized protein n=1 Tax=Cricetulus griseus TaxID=10029 RepID=G3I2K4_CRIGR|nr:hypothetical protein I79_017640 [Cricetulus griseus]